MLKLYKILLFSISKYAWLVDKNDSLPFPEREKPCFFIPLQPSTAQKLFYPIEFWILYPFSDVSTFTAIYPYMKMSSQNLNRHSRRLRQGFSTFGAYQCDQRALNYQNRCFDVFKSPYFKVSNFDFFSLSFQFGAPIYIILIRKKKCFQNT